MSGNIFQNPQNFDWRADVRKNFTTQRKNFKIFFGKIFLTSSKVGVTFIKQPPQTVEKIKNPRQKKTFCQGRILFQVQKIRGATLFHGLTHALSEVPSYFRQLTYANTSQNTKFKKLFLAPSAVHLTNCF